MVGLKLEHVKRGIYSRVCEKVSEANIPYSSLKIKYNGDQNYGDISFELSYANNYDTAFEVIRILNEVYCEMKQKNESK